LSRHHHHECRPLRCFPCESTKSDSREVRAYLHEAAKHCFPTHVWLVHQQIRQNDDQRSQRESTEMGCRLASLQRFEPLATCLFVGVSYASVACYPMNDCNVINIGLCLIKQCGMCSKEYKNWIACESKTPAIIKTIDSFKEYWARAIKLVNQTSISAAQHSCGMAETDNDALHASYSKLLTNFSAAYAATQETVKTQATSMAAMQGQLMNIQKFCMTVGQQPPPTIYAPTQQHHMSNNCHGRCNGGGHNGGSGSSNGGGGFSQQPTWFGGNRAGTQQQSFPPTPFKHWENWNYCHTRGGDVDDAHTSATGGNRGPTHNPNASRANIMGGLIAGMHKTILPLARGRKPPPTHSPQQQQLPQQCPPGAYYPTQGTNAPPAYFWSNPTCRWHLPPADDHGHASYSALSNHDEFCWPAVPSKRRGRSNNAAANPTGNAHDGTLLCSQPADLLCPQPTASGVFLTSRSGQ
jgi:hypothetical protein